MPLSVEIDVVVPIASLNLACLAALLRWAGDAEQRVPRGNWQLTLRLTDDTEIAALHARYFDDPSPTDVISFPSGDDFERLEGYLGDIVISVDTALGQAAEAGHDLDREVAF